MWVLLFFPALHKLFYFLQPNHQTRTVTLRNSSLVRKRFKDRRSDEVSSINFTWSRRANLWVNATENQYFQYGTLRCTEDLIETYAHKQVVFVMHSVRAELEDLKSPKTSEKHQNIFFFRMTISMWPSPDNECAWHVSVIYFIYECCRSERLLYTKISA